MHTRTAHTAARREQSETQNIHRPKHATQHTNGENVLILKYSSMRLVRFHVTSCANPNVWWKWGQHEMRRRSTMGAKFSFYVSVEQIMNFISSLDTVDTACHVAAHFSFLSLFFGYLCAARKQRRALCFPHAEFRHGDRSHTISRWLNCISCPIGR